MLADPDRPNNLWEPLTGDHGAHGRFSSRSADYSVQTWVNERLPFVLTAVGAAALLMGVRKWRAA
jgi:hypothetical protein